MQRLTPEERRRHTIPGRRANQYKAAERQVRRIADAPLLTVEQRQKLAAILLDRAGAES